MSDPAPRFLAPRFVVPALAAILLGIYAALALHVARTTSPTFDEPDQLAVGYASLTQVHHPYSVINLRFSQIWAALPLLTFDPPPVFPSAEQQSEATDQGINYGRLFLFTNGNQPEAILFAARAMIVSLGVVLGLVIFLVSRRLHGDLAGLLSLTLFCFSPLVIANSAVATTEIATALFFTLSVLALWHLLHRPGPLSILLAGLATGLLATTKISSLLIAPIAVILLGLRVYAFPRDEPAASRSLPRTGAKLLGALLAAAFVSWLVVWAVYGGPSAASSPGRGPWLVHAHYADSFAISSIEQLRLWRILPHSYLYDLHQFVQSGSIRRAYLLGEYSLNGWWYFFPVAWLVKNPLPCLLACFAAVVVAWQLRHRPTREGGVAWSGLTPLAVLVAIYLGFSIAGNLNIGARHLLPVYPALLIFAGLAVKLTFTNPRLRTGFLAVLFGGSALEAAFIHPQPIAYFNLLAGGPKNGHRILSDSSGDWGESLPAVQRWLDHRATTPDASQPVFFSFFGCADLAHYGITEPRVVLLPQFYDTRAIRPYLLAPGAYVISTTMLNCIYNGHFMGPWRASYEALYQSSLQDMAKLRTAMRSQESLDALMAAEGTSTWLNRVSQFDYLRFSRLCAYLRQREPDERITYGMHVYHLTLADLDAALNAPPVELRPADAIKHADRYPNEALDFVR